MNLKNSQMYKKNHKKKIISVITCTVPTLTSNIYENKLENLHSNTEERNLLVIDTRKTKNFFDNI